MGRRCTQAVDMKTAGGYDRVHFFAVSAQMMRRILVGRRPRPAPRESGSGDGARRRTGCPDDALNALAGMDPRKA